ncbi:MAG: hypothetical protein MPJ50_17445 [Pirellulales bacterium]|nr:hypothetical protein [Pirellulales bacterium]
MSQDPSNLERGEANCAEIAKAKFVGTPPVLHDAGIVWPSELGVGSLADLMTAVRSKKANSFSTLQGMLGPQKLIAVTPAHGLEDSNSSAAERARSVVRAVLSAHRPRLIVCCSTLRVQQSPNFREADVASECLTDSSPEKKFAVTWGTSLTNADGQAIQFDRPEQSPDLRQADRFEQAEWYVTAAPWTTSAKTRLVSSPYPIIVRQECDVRGIPLVAMGVVRWSAGQRPSAELTDYRASKSGVRKLGRMLRWAVKNRDAMRETAKAAEDDLIAADKLAAAIRLLTTTGSMGEDV